MADTAKLLVQLGLRDGLSGPLGRLQGRLGSFQSGLGRVGTGVGQVGLGLARIGVIAGGAAVIGIAAAAKAAIEFEDAFAGVKKTVQGTPQQLNEISQGLRNMALEIPVSVIELANIAEQAGALGVARQDILEFTRVVALLAVTTDLSAGEAATSLGKLQNVLKLGRDDLDNFGAALVDLGNKGASTESEIIAIAERAGASADLIGLSDAATLGWSASLANLGIESEAAGSSLQRFFLGSLKNIQDDKTLQIMAQTAGTTAQAFKQAFEQDSSKALQTFIVGLGKLKKAEQLAVLEALGFTDIRIARAILGLAGNTDNLTKSLRTSKQAWKDNTALTKESEKRFRTTKSELQKMGNAFFDMGITIGTNVLPPLRRFAETVAKLIREHQPEIKRFGKELGKALTGFVADFQAGKFDPIIEGLRTIASVGKRIAEIFLGLPPEVITALAGFAIANKASGGLLGTGAVNILGGLKEAIRGALTGGLKGGLGGLLGGRGSTPLNPLFVKVVGGLPGTGGGPAGGGKGGFRLPSWWPAIAGAGGLTGLVTLIAGVATPFLLFNLIPKLVNAPAAKPGTFAHPETTDITIGSSSSNPIHTVLPAGTTAMWTGLQPSWPTFAANVGTVVGNTQRTTELVARGNDALLRIRAQQWEAHQRELTQDLQTKLATERGFTKANAALGITAKGTRETAQNTRNTTESVRRNIQTTQASKLATERGFAIANRALGGMGVHIRSVAAATHNSTIVQRSNLRNTGKANAILSQIRAKRTSVRVDVANTVNATISARETTNTVTSYNTVKANTLLGII